MAFSFEDAELFSNGGISIPAVPVSPSPSAHEASRPALKKVSSLDQVLEIAEKDLGMSFSFEDAELYSNGGVSMPAIPVNTSPTAQEDLVPSLRKVSSLDKVLEFAESFEFNDGNDADAVAQLSYFDKQIRENEISKSEVLADEHDHEYSSATAIPMLTEDSKDQTYMALLRLSGELCEHFDKPAFQEELHKLVSAECKRQSKPPNTRLGAVLGRMELLMKVHAKVLPKYGLLGTRNGVVAMQMALEPYLDDAQMLRKMLAIDDLLWMPTGSTASDCKYYANLMRPQHMQAA